MTNLQGKSVLVAGASSGIGRAISLGAARAGARLTIFARRPDALATVQDEIKSVGADVQAIHGDATDPDAVRRAVTAATERFGALDIVVNSVGTNITDRALTRITPNGWRELMSNLDAAFAITHAAVPALRESKGLLVHLSSVAAKKPDMSGIGYQATKAGVAALAHATSEEERRNGVRVSVIFPGITDTPLVHNRPVPLRNEELAKAIQPEDVAAMCLAVMALPKRAYVQEVVVIPSSS